MQMYVASGPDAELPLMRRTNPITGFWFAHKKREIQKQASELRNVHWCSIEINSLANILLFDLKNPSFRPDPHISKAAAAQ